MLDMMDKYILSKIIHKNFKQPWISRNSKGGISRDTTTGQDPQT